MSLDWAFVSHVGCWRTENQDCFADLSHKNVFAVADGMGGLADGAAASQLACKAFRYQSDHAPFQLPGYFQLAHDMVLKAAAKRGLDPNKMGTTGVVLLINPTQYDYTVCWCGDSRLYHYHAQENRLEQITADHSVVQALVEQGKLTAEQASNHAQKNIITHAIGIGPSDIKTSSKRKTAREGDVLILCTDGLSNEVSAQQMEHLCNTHTSVQMLAEALVSTAMDNGGHDNITVGVVRVVPFDE